MSSRSSEEPWWGSKEAPKNLHAAVPETESKIDQKHLDVYAFFFMCIVIQSQRKIPKGPKF